MLDDREVLRDLSEIIQDGTWQKLSRRARLVALVIKFHIGWKKQFPSAKQLQEYAKLSKLSLAKALAQLKEQGVLLYLPYCKLRDLASMQEAIKEMLDEEFKNNLLVKASSSPTDKVHIPRPVSGRLVTVDMAMRVCQVIKRYARYSPGKTFTPIKVVIEKVEKDGITEAQVMSSLEMLEEQQRIKRRDKDNVYVK